MSMVGNGIEVRFLSLKMYILFMEQDIIGKWRIIRKIDEGSYADVYLAEEVYNPENRVALKIFEKNISRLIVKSFRREITAIMMLRHPYIVEMKDYSVNPMYIAYELMDYTLEDYIIRYPLSFEEALDIWIKIVDAIAYAHSKGIVHQDINPRNILVKNSTVKISDFGISELIKIKMREEGEKYKTLEKRKITGLLYWVSPEQQAGIIDMRNDIYSLGKLLHYLLTSGGILPQVITIQHLEAYNYPEWCKKIIIKCLQPLDKRYQTINQLIEEVRKNIKPKTHRIEELSRLAAELITQGVTLGRQGKYSEAEEAYRRAKELGFSS